MLLTIDSGANLGWALFELPGKLVECGYCKGTITGRVLDVAEEHRREFKRIVIERPHAGKTRARARDILTLAVRAGEAGGLLRHLTGVEPEYLEPSRWKGQLSKTHSNEITEGKLTPIEKLILTKGAPKKTSQNHVLDAIGIGLYLVGR